MVSIRLSIAKGDFDRHHNVSTAIQLTLVPLPLCRRAVLAAVLVCKDDVTSIAFAHIAACMAASASRPSIYTPLSTRLSLHAPSLSLSLSWQTLHCSLLAWYIAIFESSEHGRPLSASTNVASDAPCPRVAFTNHQHKFGIWILRLHGINLLFEAKM